MTIKDKAKDAAEKLKAAVENADRNSRARDAEITFALSEIVESANEAATAVEDLTEGKMVLARKKKVSRVHFTQIIQANQRWVIESSYLTDREMLFLYKLSGWIEPYTGLVCLHTKKGRVILTISDVARKFKLTRAWVSQIIQALITKRVIAKIILMPDENQFNEKIALIVNPNIMCVTNKIYIPAHLKKIFPADAIPALPVKLY